MNSSAGIRVHAFQNYEKNTLGKDKIMSQVSLDFRIGNPFVMVTVNRILYNAYFSRSSHKTYGFNLV